MSQLNNSHNENKNSKTRVAEILKEEFYKNWKSKKKKQKEFAEFLGIEASYLSELMHGIKDGSRIIPILASKLGKNPLDFYTMKGLEHIPLPDFKGRFAPVISWVHAGLFEECVDMWPVGVSLEGERIPVHEGISEHAFALRVVGDSMEPYFLEGDYIIIDPMAVVNNGDKCIVKVNDDVSLKIMKERNDYILLSSLNKKYPEQIIRKDSSVDFKVIGKVVEMRRKE